MIRYTRILVCPKTGREVSTKGHFYNAGICERCGDEQHGTICHAHKEVGHWDYNRRWYQFWIRPTWVQKDA